MRKILSFAVVCTLLAVAAPASADTFVWKDQKYDYTMSFPDSWRIQTEDTPTTRLRIAGPLAEDIATCRMQVDDDGRTRIYPKRLMDEAVVEKLDQNFWEGHVAQYKNAQLAAFYAPASLSGKGDATAVKFTFTDGTGAQMYGVGIASLYAEKKFITTCSSKSDVYGRWADVFASIMDSVELKSKYHPFAIGYYRDFLADPKLVLPRVKPGTVSRNSFWFDNRYNSSRDVEVYNR